MLSGDVRGGHQLVVGVFLVNFNNRYTNFP